MKTSLFVGLAVSVTAMVAIITITLVVVFSPNTGGLQNWEEVLMFSIKTDSIDHFLRNLTWLPHPAGSDQDKAVADLIATTWKNQGLYHVKLLPYQVYLARPDPEAPNMFHILDATGNITFSSSPTQPQVDEFPQEGQENLLSFNAFSGVDHVQTNRVVFANFGQLSDFEYLEEVGVEVAGAIVLIRYNKLFRGDKVRFAEARGAAGVILYTDPGDAAPLGPSATYPHTVYAPPGATQLGSLRLQGDLLTPGYPATDTSWPIPEEEADLPAIPVQPVGYGDAQNILSILTGPDAPEEWQGGLDLTYRLGGDLAAGVEFRLEVNNVNERQTVYNVVGVLPGLQEPDRYVLVGNHHDAWTYGGVDPSSATATLLEMSRAMASMYHDGWRPRRSVLFLSWGAEEPGVIGSTEFAEQFSVSLKDRAVVYLNVDMVMEGNYSFMASSVPMLYDAVIDVAKLVPNPDPDEVSDGRGSLYDTWMDRFPSNATTWKEREEEVMDEEEMVEEPLFYTMGSGSDFRAFLFNLGIPSLDMCFTSAPDDLGLPLYHSAYETYELATRLLDQGLHYHQAMARMWGVLAVRFASSLVHPYSLDRYAAFIRTEFDSFRKEYQAELLILGVKLTHLDATITHLAKNIEQFQRDLQDEDWNNDLTLRRYNDAMMLMERSLLSPKGLPDRPTLNHVLMAPSSLNGYVWDVFPVLRDVLRMRDEWPSNHTTHVLKYHVAAITHHLNMSATALAPNLW